MIAEREQLIPSAPDLGLQLACKVASGRRDQQGGKLLFQIAFFPRHG